MSYGFNPFTGKLDIKPSTVSASYSGDVTVFRGTPKEFKLGDEVFEMISTGLYAFDGLSHNGTTFTVGAGDGHIVDKENNLYYDTPWAVITGNSPATANGVTYVFIDNTGSVFTQTSIPIPDNLRDRIYIGRVITQGGVIVQVQDEPVVILHTTNQFYDLGKALGIFNISGNEISANGANLNIDKSLGYLFSLGSNYTTNVKNPHEVTIAATSPTTFAYITQLSGSTGASTITIDPANYDVAGTITAIPGSNNRASIQRVYAFPSSNIRIQYGQNWYNNLSEALQAVNTGTFVINPSIPGNGVLIGLIVLIKSATDLSDPTQAQFLLASRFGQSSIGAAGRSVTSLQQAYNNSITPEIVVDANNGAVTIKDAVTPVGVNLLEVTDNADVPVFEVDITGITSGGDNAIFNANKLQTQPVSTTTPTTGQVLTYSGTDWAPSTLAAGSGDVVGPASNTKDATIPLFSGTTGKLLKDSAIPLLQPSTNALHIGKGSTLSAVIESTTFGNNITNTTAGGTVFGYNANNSGGSMAIGRNSVSTGNQSTSIGSAAQATADFTFALGTSAVASATNAVYIGYAGKSRGVNAIGIAGAAIEAYTNDCFIGNYTRGVSTAYSNSTCIGAGSTTRTITSTQSVAINTQSATLATRAVGIGVNSQCNAGNGVSIGYLSVLTNGYVSLGYNNNINSGSSVVVGSGNAFTSGGQFNLIYGASNTETSGNYKFIYGYSVATGIYESIFCVGRSITVYENNTAMVGGQNSPINKLFLGTGQKSNATQSDVYYSLSSPTTSSNIAGKNLYILGSGSTGTAKGGWVYQSVIYGTSASGTTENATKADVTIATSDLEFIIRANSSAPTDANIPNGFICPYLDESGNNLIFRVRYSSGTLKTATIALV